MELPLSERKTKHSQRIIALVFILVAAGIVAYAAWSSSQVSEQLAVTPVVEDPAPAAVAPTDYLYFSAIPLGATSSITYEYNLIKSEWRPILDYPYHGNFYPLTNSTGLVTMPNIETESEIVVDENGYRPAYIDTTTGEFNYLATPAGYNEQYYQVAPTQNGLMAYMQRPVDADPAASQIDVTSWEVVVHNSVTGENIIITEAMYPQWFSATQLLILRETGVYMHDLPTGQEASFNIPLVEYSAANQFVYSGASSTHPLLAMVATEENAFSVIGNVTDEETGEVSTALQYSVSQENGSYGNAVVSPDQTKFALISVVGTSEAAALAGSIQVYAFGNIEAVTEIDLPAFDPLSVTLLGWR